MNVSSRAAAISNPDGNSKRAWLLALCLSLGAALAIISPYFWKGTASGHDFAFHAASWMDAANQLRDGILLPRWAEGANHGFGEPRFIFYPPVSWLFGAFLGSVAPWDYVPAAFIVLTQTLAGLSAFTLLRRLIPMRGALIGAVCYAANPYALLIAYIRSDFAEQLALVFFPTLILAVLEVLQLLDAEERPTRRSVALLAINFAAVWLTNAPAGVIATYSLALLFVWVAVTTKSWRRLLHGGVAMALGFGLASFYLVPAAYEQSWVNISQALSSGLRPAQNFLYAVIADKEHNEFNRIASNTAVLMLVLTAVFGAASFETDRKSQTQNLTRAVWLILFLLSVAAVFLMLRPSNFFWAFLPELRFVQFPWRWMSVLAIPFSCFIAAVVGQKRIRWYGVAAIGAALAVTLGCAGAWMVHHTWWDAEDIPTLQEALQNDEGFEGVDEYDPVGDDHTDLPEKAERIKLLPAQGRAVSSPEGQVHVEQWSAERKGMRITTQQPLRVALRLLDYPAWRVEVNNAPVLPQKADGTARIIVPLKPGTSHIVVRFIRTRDRTIGGVVSILSLVVVVSLFAIPKRQP